MKTLLTTLLLLSSLPLLWAQSAQNGRRAPTVYFVLTDSSLVSGRVIRQDSSMVVVRKRNGDLTYLETYQIARRLASLPRKPDQSASALTSFSLKDGSVVYGRIVRRTPVALVVRQQNGTQTYIDPGDILSTATVAASTDLPSLPITSRNVPKVADQGAIPYLLNSRPAFTPSAGQLYYRNTYLIRNELEAGITNGWSMGVVFNPLLTTFYRTSEYLNNALYLNTDFGTQLYTRIGIPIGQKLRVGATLSVNLQRPAYFSSTQTAFMGQVLTTFGDRRSNFTLGYAFGLGREQSFLLPPGTLTIGAMQSLSPSLTFISDNTIKIESSNSGPFVRSSAALRIHSRNHAFDVGASSSADPYNYFGSQINVYPYLGYNVQFGRRE